MRTMHKCISLAIAAAFVLTITSAIASAEEGDVIVRNNFGGGSFDNFYGVTGVPGGFVAVGYSWEESFNTGDWAGVTGKGGEDAIIVRFDNNGNVVWRKNFGGAGADQFWGVTAVPGGVVAVGESYAASFGNGDWEGVTGYVRQSAIIVKYDDDGNVIWKKRFGSNGTDYFFSVTTVSDGIVVIGTSSGGVGTGDWAELTAKGTTDGVIVKLDNNGNVIWKNSFGGADNDYFRSVTTVSDGVIVVGSSDYGSFGTGDWTGVIGNGGDDAFIVKYNNSGDLVWKKNFGGAAADEFSSVTAVSDGIVAVGSSASGSFGTGDWTGITGKGGTDATIAKFDNSGNIVWKKNFGGTDNIEWFNSVTAVPDGVVAVGITLQSSFGTGDWEGIEGKGGLDAIIVRYDDDGNVVWKKNFGGSGSESFLDVVAIRGAVIAVGFAHEATFGTGDWTGVTGKGSSDGIFVLFEISEPMSEPIPEETPKERSDALLWMLAAFMIIIFLLIFMDDDDDDEKKERP